MSTSPQNCSFCRLSSQLADNCFSSQSPPVSVDNPVIVGSVNAGVVRSGFSLIISSEISRLLNFAMSALLSQTVCAVDKGDTPNTLSHFFAACNKNKAH